MNQSKNIAILTGATGGLGYAFVKELCKERIDEIWAIGRNTDRLEKLVEEFGSIIVPLKLDLTKPEALSMLSEALQNQKPHLEFLINNAGIAQMKPSKDLSTAEIDATIDLILKLRFSLQISVCLICIRAAGSSTYARHRHFSRRPISISMHPQRRLNTVIPGH